MEIPWNSTRSCHFTRAHESRGSQTTKVQKTEWMSPCSFQFPLESVLSGLGNILRTLPDRESGGDGKMVVELNEWIRK